MYWCLGAEVFGGLVICIFRLTWFYWARSVLLFPRLRFLVVLRTQIVFFFWIDFGVLSIFRPLPFAFFITLIFLFFISNTRLFIRCNYSYLFNFIVKFSSFFLLNLLNPFVNILICLKNYISMQNCSCFYWFQHSFYRLFYSLLIISINIYRFQCLFRINPFFNKYFLHF